MNSLSQELMQFALTGVDESVFIDAIRSKLETGLQRYATTYATTSRAKFIQQVQDEAAKSYDGELYWEYVGPEDDRMRDALYSRHEDFTSAPSSRDSRGGLGIAALLNR